VYRARSVRVIRRALHHPRVPPPESFRRRQVAVDLHREGLIDRQLLARIDDKVLAGFGAAPAVESSICCPLGILELGGWGVGASYLRLSGAPARQFVRRSKFELVLRPRGLILEVEKRHCARRCARNARSDRREQTACDN